MKKRQLYLALLESPHVTPFIYLSGWLLTSLLFLSIINAKGKHPWVPLTHWGGERLLSVQNHILNVLHSKEWSYWSARCPLLQYADIHLVGIPPPRSGQTPVAEARGSFWVWQWLFPWDKCFGNALWLQLWDSRSGHSPTPFLWAPKHP